MSMSVVSGDYDRLMPPRTLADAVLTRGEKQTRSAPLADGALVFGASLLVALSAQIAIHLPFTPVPVTGQTFAVLLTGMLLGGRRGAFAIALYLWEGAIGLPFFAGATGGIGVLFGHTAGYLWSFPLAAALVGFLAERGWDRRPLGAAVTMSAGSALILACGVLYLTRFLGGSVPIAFAAGALPFLPGEAVKIALATALLPGGWAVVRRLSPPRD